VQIATIIQEPHLLYVGANGHKTAGIRVRTIGSEEDVEKRGYSREWSINAYTFSANIKWVPDSLGISMEEATKMLEKLKEIEGGTI